MGSVEDQAREFLARATSRDRSEARVVSLDSLARPESQAPWGFAALRGRLVELSARGATATLTTAMEIVVEAQTAGDPVAWITLETSTFYPPDAADGGVDLAALVVIRVADTITAARAAERVLRSGAFGLVIFDVPELSGPSGDLSMTHQGRLVTLAQSHDAAVIFLTEKSADGASVGSLISLRVEALRTGSEVHLRALKDKRRGPDWFHKRRIRGPSGY